MFYVPREWPSKTTLHIGALTRTAMIEFEVKSSYVEMDKSKAELIGIDRVTAGRTSVRFIQEYMSWNRIVVPM